jgi:hypothetical protein
LNVLPVLPCKHPAILYHSSAFTILMCPHISICLDILSMENRLRDTIKAENAKRRRDSANFLQTSERVLPLALLALTHQLRGVDLVSHGLSCVCIRGAPPSISPGSFLTYLLYHPPPTCMRNLGLADSLHYFVTVALTHIVYYPVNSVLLIGSLLRLSSGRGTRQVRRRGGKQRYPSSTFLWLSIITTSSQLVNKASWIDCKVTSEAISQLRG